MVGRNHSRAFLRNIFRVNNLSLTSNVTIAVTEGATATGPITLADNVILTVNGELSVV